MFARKQELKKSVQDDDIFATIGYNVSLSWRLGKTFSKITYALVYHSSTIIADILNCDCKTKGNFSATCDIWKDKDEWIISLNIINVTEQSRGEYSLRYKGLIQGSIENSSKMLVVIGKPSVREVRKPMLNQAFELSCINSFGLHCVTYNWKVNGSEIHLNNNATFVTSLDLSDNFSQITCQMCFNTTVTNSSSENLKHTACSDESEPYEINVFYGPENVSLSLKERHFYVKLFESFTIYCFASCNPRCTFRWIGHDTINGEKLAITGFEPRMAGQYTCYVTNQQTNTTSSADPIIIHHDKGEKLQVQETGGIHLMQYWIGPVTGSAIVMSVGVLILYIRLKTTRGKDFRGFRQSCIRQNEGEISELDVRRSNQSFSHTAVKKHAARKTTNIKQDTSIEMRANNSISEQVEDNPVVKLQEDPYSKVDDDAISVHDHMTENLFESHSHQTGKTAEHMLCDYARSTVETPTVHVTVENYITPISNLSDISQAESYITATSNLPRSNEHRAHVEMEELGTN